MNLPKLSTCTWTTMASLVSVGCGSQEQFSIVVLPDTQNYISHTDGGTQDIFAEQISWIIENREALNIVFVTHVGDLVQNGDTYETEWDAAERIMSALEDPERTGLTDGIPYGIAPGNNDGSRSEDGGMNAIRYNERFGTGRFAARPYYGGNFGENNNNHFELFSGGGYDFLILHLEDDRAPSPEVLAWADSVLTEHPGRYVFVTTHNLVELGNPGRFSNQGEATYEALKHHPNLIIMLGGHITGNGEGQRTDHFNGSTVHSLLSNYQSYENGGNGWLRILRFSPAENKVRISTFSPTINDGEGGYLSDHDSEFELDIEFQQLN